MTQPAPAAGGPCARCGQPHERAGRATCTAHTRREGELRPCGNYPIQGGTVCRFHGGGAPQTRARAARRQVDEHMDNVLRLAVRDVDPRHASRSPDEQLLEEVARSAQVVEWLATRVAELKVPDPTEEGNPFADLAGVDPETGEPIMEPNRYTLWGPDHTGDAAPHIYWAMLNQERDRHAKLCKLAIDAGISERLVRIAEAQGAAIVGVLLKVLERLNLDAKQLETAKRYAAQELRALGPVVDATP